VNAWDKRRTVVSHFAVAGNSLQILRFLSQRGLEFDGAAQIAASFHRNAIFRGIELMTSATPEDTFGKLPMACAAASNNIELIMSLIRRGIDVNACESFGYSPLHAASKAGHCHAIALLLGTEAVNPNITDIWGTTPLHVAVDSNQLRAANLLLNWRAVKVNARDCKGKTPFYVAVRSGHAKMVKLFLGKQGVDVNEGSNHGNTPLHAAVKNGLEKVLKLLLAHPAVRWDVKNAKGLTAEEYAVELGRGISLQLFAAFRKNVYFFRRAKNAPRPGEIGISRVGPEKVENDRWI
jgi:ankyrin repeat protein